MPFNSLLLVLPILSLLMFGLGLELRLTQFTIFFKQPKAFFIGLFSQLIVLPAVALLLIYLFKLPTVFALGVLLLALSPGGSSSNAFSMLAGGNVALSVALTAVTSVITVFTLPLVVMLYLRSGQMIELPIAHFLAQNILLILLPLMAGMLTLHYAPKSAAKISHVIKRYGMWLLLILVIIFFMDNSNLILQHLPTLATVLLTLIIVTTTLATVLGLGFKLPKSDRRTIFIEVGMQNAAQAIAIASSPLLFHNDEMAIPAVIYAFLMNIFLLSYLFVVRFRDRHQEIHQ